MGVPIQYLNLGGGLGVDYDGSKTAFDSSMNYSVQEYANDVVYTIKQICDEEKVPAPDPRHRVGPRRHRVPLGASSRTSSTSPTASSRAAA